MIKKYTNGAWVELGKYRKYGTENYDVSTFPASMLTTGNDFEDYRIYGASEGTGERTENLWENNNFWDTGTVLSGELLFGKGYSVQPGTYTVSTDVIDNTNTSIASVFALAATETPSTAYSSDDGVFLNRPRTVTVLEGQKLWVCIRYRGSALQGYLIWDKQTFADYWIMTSKGSTAPAKYIPYGYQLNVMVGDGTTDSDIPIYIGDTPLEQGEYVDYGEQKVYKYVDGTLTPTDPPVALPAIPTLDGTTVIDFDNSPKPDRMTADYTDWFELKPKIYTNGQWVDMT